MKKMSFLTLIVLFLLALSVRAGINLLHEFANGAADGRYPLPGAKNLDPGSRITKEPKGKDQRQQQ